MKKPKITLFWPPIPQGRWNFTIYPSMGMAYLSVVLRDRGYEVDVVDANIVHGNTAEFYKDYNEINSPTKNETKTWDSILDKLIKITEKTRPDILGVGSWSYNMPVVAEFIKKYKKRNPNTTIILGGINPTLIPDLVLDVIPEVDYLFRGEGDLGFAEFIQAVSAKLKKQDSVNSVPGISYTKDGKRIHTPGRPYIKDLNELPFMDYESFIGFKEWNKDRKLMFAQVMTSRGCVANCSFCSVHQMWKKQRFYSDNYVIGQIKHLYNLYDFPSDTVAFMDDNFVVNFDKTRKLIEAFKSEFKENPWQIVDMRIDALSRNFVRYASKMGCTFMGFGVESINSKSLTFLNKTMDPAKYKRTVFSMLSEAEECGVRTMLSSIIGTPEETKEEMIQQANFYVEIYNKYKYSYFDVAPVVIHPATYHWNQYINGEIKIYKRPPHSPKRFYEGMYADKWDSLLFMVPNAYRIFNKHMTPVDFETTLSFLIKKKLQPLAREAIENISRDEVFFVEDQGLLADFRC